MVDADSTPLAPIAGTGTIASFDVFDTLLTRAVGEPTSVFLLLGKVQEVRRLSGRSPEEFAHLRVAAEQRARMGRAEVTLKEIYKELGIGLSLADEDAWRLLNCELELERRLIRKVPDADRLLAGTPASRRIALSDMYLPQPFVTELLADHGLAEKFDRIMVSSEHGATKGSGKLYRRLLELEQAPSGRVHHVGDNIRSDVRVPRLLGMHADRYQRATLNRYERLWEQHRWDTSGLSSLIAGASRMARLTYTGSEQHRVVVDVAAGAAAPILSAYVLWVLNRAQREGIRRLYFMARDGEILMLLAERLVRKLSLDIELRYLYGSRSVFYRASLAKQNVREAAWAWQAMYRLKPLDILRRLGLEDQLSETILTRLGLDGDAATPISADAIEKLVADEQVQAEAHGSAQRLLVRVQTYLTEAGMFDGTPYAIVDTGWSGRIVGALSAVFPAGAEPLRRCYLFGYMQRGDGFHCPEVIRGYLFDDFAGTGYRGEFDQAYGPLETFTATNHGMTVDFEERDGRVAPVLASDTNPALTTWPWSIYRDTLFRFVDHLVLDRDIASASADLRSGVAAALTEFWVTPTTEESEVWGAFLYEDDILASSHNRLARPITPRDFVGKIKGPYEGKRLWKAGSAQLSPVYVRPVIRLAIWYYYRRRRGPGVGVLLPHRWRRRAQLLPLIVSSRLHRVDRRTADPGDPTDRSG